MAKVLIANLGAELYGADRMAWETATGLRGAGHDVTVVLPGPGPLADLLTDAGIPVRTAPTAIVRKSALRPRGLLGLVRDAVGSVRPGLRLLADVRPDVLVVNSIVAPLWLALGRLRGVRVVCHVHEGETGLARPLAVLLHLPLHLAHHLVVNSRFSLDVVAAAAPALRRRSTVVYNAVAGPPAPTPPRPHPEPLRLLYVGRLSPRKGPDVAVAALRVLRDRGLDARLTLLGSVFTGYEWFEQQLRETVATSGLADRVQLAGFRSDRWPDTAEADVVLVPSVADEPFGNVAVEAALAARPQVVTDTGGLPEAVEGLTACVRVPPGDPEALAAAVVRIRDDWTRFAAAAEREAAPTAERFSPARYAAELDAVVRAQLGG
ncbi:glycosyltransferase involved in cell wall biosynthesis [Friedmanniella endophytica]|uniref:Glycosyltransferase involved in cell wall biosynthesis n=1 Tax=Microlunatus kandeliicorticis TaxID=1759536 RepID=A0A7W3IP55_9ACTN|nr:glycosyltransferase family 4 protein [Microlunatus kandeliicorticis]MBA8792662.1 glycosyltransferase involved in cell wall biosynthesis [Microlunatus kandeliicorticis]